MFVYKKIIMIIYFFLKASHNLFAINISIRETKVHNIPDSRSPDTKKFQMEYARRRRPTSVNQAKMLLMPV